MMNIKNIFFDLDHTLWDFETNSAKAFKFIFDETSMDIDINDFLIHYKPINQNYWKLYREEKVTKSQLRYGRLKQVFDILNYTISDDRINHLAKIYIDNLPNYNSLFNGTLEILDYLREKYQLHIITNGFDEIQELKLSRSGIKNYFDKIITSESVGVKKPNPKIFNYALQITNALPRQSIMIGDNLEADIQGAINMDMHAIFCNFENIKLDRDILSVNHLQELKQYL